MYKQNVSKDTLVEYLTEKNMNKVGDQQDYPTEISIDGEVREVNISTEFYFKLDSHEREIEWARFWETFYDGDAVRTKTVQSAFGMIIIEIDDEVYCISLGRGHSYANHFAEMDFGFDIAEVIHDQETIEVKAARFFKQSKNKSLTQYNTNSYVSTEIGESHELIISKINIDSKYSSFKLSDYEEKMKFGSAVKFEAGSFSVEDILDVVSELNVLYLHEERAGSLPRMNFVKNNEDNQAIITSLNTSLLNAVKTDESSVSLTYYIEEDGDIVIEPFNENNVEIVYDRKTYELDSYDITSISNKLSEIDCNDISKVTIRPQAESEQEKKYQREHQLPLMKLLDYSVELEGKDYCLYKGKWTSFNKSYIDFIETEIRRVNDCSVYNSDYDLTEEVLDVGKTTMLEHPDQYDQVPYAEYPYNIYLENKHNYILLDRKKGQHVYKSVEFADLYNEEDSSLIHVKIGGTPSMRYCIQQSLHSAEIFKTQSDALEVHDIYEVKKVSILLVVKTENILLEDRSIDFSNNRSIYFKIEVIEWMNKIRQLGYDPEIIIAKDLR